MVFTDGGLKVSVNLEVVRADGSVIQGLYAAGSTGQGGLLLEGHGHHLGWAFISGRIAGRNAALLTPWPSMHADVPNHEPSLLLMNCGDGRQPRPEVDECHTSCRLIGTVST